MHIAQVVAGYTLGQADMLRKAMGRKKLKRWIATKRFFLREQRRRVLI